MQLISDIVVIITVDHSPLSFQEFSRLSVFDGSFLIGNPICVLTSPL